MNPNTEYVFNRVTKYIQIEVLLIEFEPKIYKT